MSKQILQSFIVFCTLRCKTTVHSLSPMYVLVQVQSILIDKTFIAPATCVTFYAVKIYVVFVTHQYITDFTTSVAHIGLVRVSQSVVSIPLLYTLKH